MGTRSKDGYKDSENRPTESDVFPDPPKILVIRNRKIQHHKHRRRGKRGRQRVCKSLPHVRGGEPSSLG